ncbi:MAG TPA: FxSxx-COOH system tetratricopeptide repeat protein [Solirubrobacteraceae bacterium]|jgi:tetratricopeptide (TPR) repeat protein|nr:FxSxx-COOH system tetratricopeptide repeat protein [Solirubrobacteraceae bacterium]
MRASAKVDFFISYASPDLSWAEWIAWQLEHGGYTTLFQAWDFRPGQNFPLAMQNAAINADRTLAVISPAFFSSAYASTEWAAAFTEDPDGTAGKYVPVRVRECLPPGLHRGIIYIDLVGLDESGARTKLYRGVRAGRAVPQQSPGFPGGVAVARSGAPGFPGDAPPIWNVPVATRTFQGRAQALEGLTRCLKSDGRVAVTQAYAIHGLGGVGKTQLAARWAHEHRADYDVVWWIRAEQESTRLVDYAALGLRLDLAEANSHDQSWLINATKDWLERSSRWLLIFDNAPDSQTIASLLPAGEGGHVLITSRAHANWRALGAAPLQLEVWERQESIDFLARSTGSEDLLAAEEIADLLGDLPLALAQAAAYTNEQAIELSTYLRRLNVGGLKLMAKGQPLDYQHTVATTWDLAFEKVSDHPAGAGLLSVCAYFSPERIPRELLTQQGALPHELPVGKDREQLVEDAVQSLLSYALLTPAAGETLDMHRLVQQVMRERAQTTDLERLYARQAVCILAEAFPQRSWEHQHWSLCSRLLPHAQAVVGHAQALEVEPRTTAALLLSVASFFSSRGDYVKARNLDQQALEIYEAVFGPDDLRVAKALNNLGNVLQILGDSTGALAAFRRSLSIKEQIYGPTHTEVASTLNNLGNGLLQAGELDGARSIQERALQINETAYGPDHPEVAKVLGNLGAVLQDLDDFAGSRSILERALAIEENAYGSNHPEVARTMGNLGLCLRAIDLPLARSTQERVLAIEEGLYGPDHPEVARTLGNLATCQMNLGDQGSACLALERALTIFREAYGPNHPDTLRAVGMLEKLEGHDRRLDP